MTGRCLKTLQPCCCFQTGNEPTGAASGALLAHPPRISFHLFRSAPEFREVAWQCIILLACLTICPAHPAAPLRPRRQSHARSAGFHNRGTVTWLVRLTARSVERCAHTLSRLQVCCGLAAARTRSSRQPRVCISPLVGVHSRTAA